MENEREMIGLILAAANPDKSQALTGGLLHKVYSVETETGKYAVKALNPQIMLRPKAMGDYINSENISQLAAEKMSAVAALRFGGKAVQELDGRFYLIYKLVDGKSLRQNEITAEHCRVMGDTLAALHKIDFSSLGLADDYSFVRRLADWDGYLAKGEERGAPWVDLMRENLAELKRLDNDVYEASKELCENTVISHGDLESKNVIWRDGIPYIIDWESAGFVHPVFDLVETAAYWASDTEGKLRGELFDTFVSSYMRRNKIENPNWRAALKKSFQSKLGWLEYSLKRSLGIESADEKDKETGTQHVFGTIKSINDHRENIKTILYTEGDNHGS